MLDTFKNAAAKPWELRKATGDLVRSMLANFIADSLTNQERLDNLVTPGRSSIYNAGDGGIAVQIAPEVWLP